MPAQHILVPIDLSPNADHAFDYALTLARALQARLTLIHVIDPLPVGSIEIMPFTYLHDLEAKMTELMTAYRDRVTAAGLQSDFVIVHGVPFRASLRQPA